MDFISNLRDLNAWWIPILFFVFFSLVGMFIGAINGWKSSLYWTITNIISAGTAICMVSVFWNPLKELLNKILSNLRVQSSNLEILKGVMIFSFILCFALIFNLIGLLIYFFVRKKLKKSIKKNKIEGRSNTNSRIIGSGLGFISILPVNLFFTSFGTVFSQNQNINKMFSGITKLSTYGFVDNISEDYEGIYAIASSHDSFESISEIFTGENLENINYNSIKKSLNKINLLFSNKKTLPLISEIIENQKSIKKGSKLDKQKVDYIIKNYKNKLKGIFNFFSQTSKDNAKNIINKHFKKEGEKNDIAEELINFLTYKTK